MTETKMPTRIHGRMDLEELASEPPRQLPPDAQGVRLFTTVNLDTTPLDQRELRLSALHQRPLRRLRPARPPELRGQLRRHARGDLLPRIRNQRHRRARLLQRRPGRPQPTLARSLVPDGGAGETAAVQRPDLGRARGELLLRTARAALEGSGFEPVLQRGRLPAELDDPGLPDRRPVEAPGLLHDRRRRLRQQTRTPPARASRNRGGKPGAGGRSRAADSFCRRTGRRSRSRRPTATVMETYAANTFLFSEVDEESPGARLLGRPDEALLQQPARAQCTAEAMGTRK